MESYQKVGLVDCFDWCECYTETVLRANQKHVQRIWSPSQRGRGTPRHDTVEIALQAYASSARATADNRLRRIISYAFFLHLLASLLVLLPVLLLAVRRAVLCRLAFGALEQRVSSLGCSDAAL
jgi:hypothetical protein